MWALFYFTRTVGCAKELSVKPRSSSYLSPLAEGRSNSRSGGRGVFALSPISAGSLIVLWGGRVVSEEEVGELSPFRRRLILQVEEGYFLLSTVDGPGDWVNHSCEPNAGILGQISLVAIRTIEAGEEIRYDYATSESSRFEDFECGCGTSACRGRFTPNDWQLPELWERYGTCFSPYLLRRISALRSIIPA